MSLSATYFDISRLAATSISQTAINISYTFINVRAAAACSGLAASMDVHYLLWWFRLSSTAAFSTNVPIGRRWPRWPLDHCFVTGLSLGVSRYAVGAPRTHPALNVRHTHLLRHVHALSCLLPAPCACAGTEAQHGGGQRRERRRRSGWRRDGRRRDEPAAARWVAAGRLAAHLAA